MPSQSAGGYVVMFCLEDGVMVATMLVHDCADMCSTSSHESAASSRAGQAIQSSLRCRRGKIDIAGGGSRGSKGENGGSEFRVLRIGACHWGSLASFLNVLGLTVFH